MNFVLSKSFPKRKTFRLGVYFLYIKRLWIFEDSFYLCLVFIKADIMESIKNRRTIRKYKQLLEESFRASTMGNMQLYSVIVTKDAAMKARLAPAHFNQPMVTSAPVVLTFCADFNRFCKWCEQRKAVPGYNNFISFLNAASDTLLVTQNFCTLAEEKG